MKTECVYRYKKLSLSPRNEARFLPTINYPNLSINYRFAVRDKSVLFSFNPTGMQFTSTAIDEYSVMSTEMFQIRYEKFNREVLKTQVNLL